MYYYLIDFVGVFVGVCMARRWLLVVVLLTGLGVGASAVWPQVAGLPWPVLLGGMAAVYAGGLWTWYVVTEWAFNVQLRREARKAAVERANTWPPKPGAPL